MNKLQNNTYIASIDDFMNTVNESVYPDLFTPHEIEAFGKKRKKGSLAARLLIKKMIRAHFNDQVPFTDIELLNNEFGKPILHIEGKSVEEISHIHFSLSHSKDEVAVIVIFDNEV
jgi:phosphopantetheinyl transferase (holo-ACP synthase)